MNKLILSGLIGLSLSLTSAAKADCTSCNAADSLRKDIQKLNYSNADDRFKGGTKSRQAVAMLQDFAKLPKTNTTRPQLFKGLMDLSIEAAPYDGEGQIASVISDMLEKDSTLRASFAKVLAGQPKAPVADYCKAKLLDAGVGEDMCFTDAGVKGQGGNASDKIAAKCAKKFNYNDCLAGKK